MLTDFKDEDFNSKIKNEDVSVIQFSAAWCGPCKVLKPIMEKLSDEFKDINPLIFEGVSDSAAFDNALEYLVILVATGGRPFKPDIPGIENALVSDDIFNLEELPKSIAIIGGGYIACEMASIMSGFGVETKLIYRGDQILRGFDNEIRDHVAHEMSKNGISISLNADIQRINLTSNGLEITETSGRRQNFDQVLAATGRMPNSDDLG